MLTSKQRAKLRGFANTIETTQQIGKGGIEDNTVTQVLNELNARELVKLRVLENCAYSAREAATILAEQTGADVVQVIGTRFVLFLQKKKDSKYEL